MPTLLLSFKRISDSHILIHGFLSPNTRESNRDLDDHVAVCPKFGPAFKADETIEHEVEVDEIPEFDADAIGDWLDELLGLNGEEGDDEEDEEDPEEEEEEKEV